MKLKKLKIRNFRCCEAMEIDVNAMHALVGANNAGKSTVLHALDFFFNPSVKKLSDESFFQRDTTRRIEVEGIFVDLSNSERNILAPYLKPDGTFHVMRTAELAGDRDANEAADTESSFKIQAHYAKAIPTIAWLDPRQINGNAIAAWWTNKHELVANDISFADFLGRGNRPQVGVWKEKAEQFAARYLHPKDFGEGWIENPQGYAGILKGTLPHYELIPAVKEVSDEAKVTKTNPFGKLIYEIVRNLDNDLREEIERTLQSTVQRLNRGENNQRAQKVAEIEQTIAGFLAEIMPSDLELQFQAPTVDVLLTTPRVLVDDGFSGAVEGKGHGLQRAVIFAILRSYAKLVTERPDADRRTLILGVEEPELYMHPTAQRTIRKVLRAIAESGDQVFITTHSPLMVDVEYFDEIIRIEPSRQARITRAHQLPVQHLIDDLVSRHANLAGKVTEESIREKYRHAYTASRNEGFFARKVILVEGTTELYALPIYAAALGIDLDSLSISIVECGGKGQIDRLYRIFNELGIPSYVIFDGDRDNADARGETVDLLRFLGGDPEIPDAVFVGPKYTCFSRDWEADIAPLIVNYGNLRAAAREALGISAGGKSKPLIARYIARQVVQAGADHVPELIREILDRAVASERTGTCLVGRD